MTAIKVVVMMFSLAKKRKKKKDIAFCKFQEI